MRKYLLSLVFGAASLCLGGCAARPGFRTGFEFYLPPTLHTANTLTPMAAPIPTMYAVDGGADVPYIQRQIQVVPAPAQSPRRLMPAPQQLNMPRETVPGCGQVPSGGY